MLETALYIIPTPIGNLEDITLRAIRILNEVDIIACEDTRTSGNLFKALDISPKRLLAYHNFNEKESARGLVKLILEGNSLALVSDAGYPGISDPGFSIVNECINNKIKIIALPGPSSILPAFVASGFDVSAFTFLGFPPQKKGRKTFIEKALNENKSTVILESSHRIVKLLDQINEISPNRKLSIAKEISKIHERYIRGTAYECKEVLNEQNSTKGEFVVVIEKG